MHRLSTLRTLLLLRAGALHALGQHMPLRGATSASSPASSPASSSPLQRVRCRSIHTVMPEGSLLVGDTCTPPSAPKCRASVQHTQRRVVEEDPPPLPYQAPALNRYATMPMRMDSNTPDSIMRFKAQVLNSFVVHNQIKDVVEFGYSYGNDVLQSLLNFPKYSGYDTSMDLWRFYYQKFGGLPGKQYFHYEGTPPATASAEMCMSLDVVPKLELRSDVGAHLRSVFQCATKYVIIFSSNFDSPVNRDTHSKHHHFTTWVDYEFGDRWKLHGTLVNRFPSQSLSDMYVYKSVAWALECQGDQEPVHETYKWWTTMGTHAGSGGPTNLRVFGGVKRHNLDRQRELGISPLHTGVTYSRPSYTNSPRRRQFVSSASPYGSGRANQNGG